MLTVTPAQLDAVATAKEDVFVSRAVAFARDQLRPQSDAFDPAALDALVRRCRDLARAHRVESDHGTIMWLTLAIKVDPAFHDHPEVAHALANSTDNDQLMEAIVDRLGRMEAGR